MNKEKENIKSQSIYNKLIKTALTIEDLKLITGTNKPEIIFNLLFLSTSFDLKKILNNREFDFNFWDNFYETITKLLQENPRLITNDEIELIKKTKVDIISNLHGYIGQEEISKIGSIFKEINTLFVTKIDEYYKQDQYKILDSIIFDLKNLAYLKIILNKYPKYVNARNEKNESIVLKIVDYLCGTIKYDGSIENALFYSNVIREILLRKKINIELFELKDYYKKIKSTINYISSNSPNYKQKISICNTVLNLLGKNNLSINNVEQVFEKYNIKEGFSEESNKEVETILHQTPYIIISSDNVKQNCIIAIDSEDTLDRDAATIIKHQDFYEVKVFISDVAKFIPIDSFIDKEAFERTSSIYLPDNKTIFMIKQQLTDNILSLNKKGYKYVIEHNFKIYFDGSITDLTIKPKVIKMDNCLSYETANKILKKGNTDSLSTTLINLSEACSLVRSKNPKRNLYTEIKYLINCLDGKYNPSNLDIKMSSQIIVMELMISIGYLVPTLFLKNNYPFLFRNNLPLHSEKEYAKLRYLESQIANKNISKVEKEKIIDLLENLYSKAYYSSNNDGHAGLNLSQYAHIGSPERRYSDLTDQRLEYDYMFTAPSLEKDRYWQKRLPEIVEHCNNQATIIDEFYKEYCLVKSL